jgi:hypothetical protein
MFRAALPRTNYSPLIVFIAVLVFFPTAFVFAEDPKGLGGVLYSLFTTIGGVFTWVGGGILDYAVTMLVIRMGDLLTGNIGVAVDNLWMVIRDVFNILFIFGLIWIGLQTILGIGDSKLQKTLGNIIIAALLINFSLFITKAVIDFSNIAATQIYQTGFQDLTNSRVDLVRDTGIEGIVPGYDVAGGFSISSVFMANMELNSFAAELIAPEEGGPGFINLRAAGYGFLIMILQIIAGFVFLSGGILLIYRFIALIVYMIFSPAMFVGLIFAKFMKYQNQWWNGFLSNAFVAPAYLFMLYLAAAVFTGLNGVTQAVEVSTFSAGFNPGSIASGGFAIFLFFAVMAGFLIAATMVAKQMGAAGASTVMKVGMTGANTLRGMAVGSARGVGRGVGGFGLRGVNRAAEGARSSLNSGLNTMGQGGAVSRATARTLDRTLGSRLDRATQASVLGSETAEQQRTRIQTQQQRFNTGAQQDQRSATIDEQIARIDNNQGDSPAARGARTDARNQLANQVRRLSDQELIEMQQRNPALLMNGNFSQHLSENQVTALRNAGVLTNTQMSELTDNRNNGVFESFDETLDSASASARELDDTIEQLSQTLQRMPIERLQGLGSTRLGSQRIATHLTDRQIEDLQSSGRFTATEIRQIRDARSAGLSAIAAGDAPQVAGGTNQQAAMQRRRERMFQTSAQEAGRLPASVFTERDMAQYITPPALTQRVRNGLSQAEYSAIETNIMNHITDPSTPARITRMWQEWANNTTEGSRFNF